MNGSSIIIFWPSMALEGPTFDKLIPPIDIHDVRLQASARDLFQEWVTKIDNATWLSTIISLILH